jgi:hypothetical protein
VSELFLIVAQGRAQSTRRRDMAGANGPPTLGVLLVHDSPPSGRRAVQSRSGEPCAVGNGILAANEAGHSNTMARSAQGRVEQLVVRR